MVPGVEEACAVLQTLPFEGIAPRELGGAGCLLVIESFKAFREQVRARAITLQLSLSYRLAYCFTHQGLAKSCYSSFSRPPSSLSSKKSASLLSPTIFSVSITSPTFFSSSTCSVTNHCRKAWLA